MGLRFHKSIKIAPGLKLNLNKKSISLTGGVRGAHYTVSSTGKRTASVGIPGTGLSYSKTTGGNSKKKRTGKKEDSEGGSGTFLKVVIIILLLAILVVLCKLAGII